MRYLSQPVGDGERVHSSVLRLAAVDAEPDHAARLVHEVDRLRWTDGQTWGQEVYIT